MCKCKKIYIHINLEDNGLFTDVCNCTLHWLAPVWKVFHALLPLPKSELILLKTRAFSRSGSTLGGSEPRSVSFQSACGRLGGQPGPSALHGHGRNLCRAGMFGNRSGPEDSMYFSFVCGEGRPHCILAWF